MKTYPVTPEVVNSVRTLLGEDALLIPWKYGEKAGRKRWGRIPPEKMRDRKYLKNLLGHNLGVVLGSKSNGLISVDIDDDDAVKLFTGEPWSNTLRTKGRRGSNFWFRIKGECPHAQHIYDTEGNDLGEWRAEGNQTIVAGSHPKGMAYEILNSVPPVELTFGELKWPNRIQPPDHDRLPSVNCTDVTELTDVTDETDEVIASLSTSPKLCLEQLLDLTRPKAGGENHKLLFLLARGIRGMEKQDGKKLPAHELKTVFSHWYSNAEGCTKPESTKEDYWVEFLVALENVKVPLGAAEQLQTAWIKAVTEPVPNDALVFDSEELRKVVALCRNLQIQAGLGPFFLSSRKLAQLLGHPTHSTSASWLKAMLGAGLLKVMKHGNRVHAHRYAYLPVWTP